MGGPLIWTQIGWNKVSFLEVSSFSGVKFVRTAFGVRKIREVSLFGGVKTASGEIKIREVS